MIGLLIAKPGEFDTLGGVDLVTSVMLSMRAWGAAQPAPSAPPTREPYMQPHYAGGSLDVPPPDRRQFRRHARRAAPSFQEQVSRARQLRDGAGHGTDVDHRVEAIEKTRTVFAMILPAAANVVGIDQFASFDQRVRLRRQCRDLVVAKDGFPNEAPVTRIASQFGCGEG